MGRYNSHLDLEQCAPLATITLSLSDPFSVIWNVLLLQSYSQLGFLVIDAATATVLGRQELRNMSLCKN